VPQRDTTRGAAALTARLSVLIRRLRADGLLKAIAIGCALAAGAMASALGAGAGRGTAAAAAIVTAIGASGVTALRARHRWTAAHAARRAEDAEPGARNVVITGEELLRHPDRASPWMRARILSQAADVVSAIDAARAVPLGRRLAWCAAAAALWIVVALGIPQRTVALVSDAVRHPSAQREDGSPTIAATITAPSYLGGAVQTLRNPEKIEAVAGSRLSLSLTGSASWRTRLGTREIPRAAGQGSSLVLSESSYLAIEPETPGRGDRKLIPVVVTPDRVPSIRIEQPGKDLLLPDARSDVAVAAAANDDFGLASLELRFTKVSGSGEQFEFEEGGIPLALERSSPRSWRGRAALALSRMKLEPGDSLVYRVVGADARGGDAGGASSDTFFVEIAAPGEVAVAGFELPPDRERYALSQQMIVLKIERLRQRERAMSADAVAKEAGNIAAEQRAVRANFIFLNGGEVEDEEEEAAHSHEIQEGRLAHTARREIAEAIQHMGRAEKELIAVSTTGALPPAKAAVEALQRAFGRNRYILRSMPVRSRLDPSRRLSGELQAAVDSKRAAHDPSSDLTAITARRLMGELLNLGPLLLADDRSRVQSARLSALAEEALAAGAGTTEWQNVSASLLQLRDALAAGRPAPDVRSRYATTLDALQAEVRKNAIPPAPSSPAGSALRSAWVLEQQAERGMATETRPGRKGRGTGRGGGTPRQTRK
jgi:hypothetical protein